MPTRPNRARALGAVIAACAAAAVPACASSTPQPRAGAGSASRSAAKPSPRHQGRSTAGSGITLAFAGDVHFTGRTAKLLRHPATAFGPIAGLLSSADLTLVNLETAVTARGKPQPKFYHFRARPAAFTALRDAGIDVANMANNHVLDYGRIGLADTLAAAHGAHFPVLGIGSDAAAA